MTGDILQMYFYKELMTAQQHRQNINITPAILTILFSERDETDYGLDLLFNENGVILYFLYAGSNFRVEGFSN